MSATNEHRNEPTSADTLDHYIDRLVASAPPLTQAQRSRIAALAAGAA